MSLLAISIPCWLIPLLVGLICAVLGYLIGGLSRRMNGAVNDLEDKVAKLETGLKSCSRQKASLQAELDAHKRSKDNEESKIRLSSTEVGTSAALVGKTSEESVTKEILFDAAAAKAIFGKKIKEDDLKIVEGIGPKIEELFHFAGVTTWKALSETSIEKCEEILKAGGERFRLHKPDTWPDQARLAFEGKWQELANWQDKLNGGKI